MSAEEAIWTSLPVPALMLDAEDRITRINPAAEGFLMSSARAVTGQPVWDRLAVDAPLEDALQRARAHDAPLFVNDVDVGTGDRAAGAVQSADRAAERRAGGDAVADLTARAADGWCRTARSNRAANRPSAWQRCWRMRSRTRWRASPGRHSFCRWGLKPMIWN